MAGIRAWRCTRCDHIASVIVAEEKMLLLCGDCFYSDTVKKIMTAVFLPDPVTVSSSDRPAADPR